MTRWRHTLAGLCLALVVCFANAVRAGSVHAADETQRVIGWGYAFDLPPRFTPRADDPPPRSRILDEVLIWSLPLRVMGEPRRAGYGIGNLGAPEATLRACRFVMAEERAPESVLDIAQDAVRSSYEEVVDTLTMSNLIDCKFRQTRNGIPLVLAKITYKHHESGPRFVQSALFLKGTTGLVITLEAPYDMQFEYEAYFLKLLDSLNLMAAAPTLMEQVRVPGLILMGVLSLCLLFLILRRRARQKRLMRPVPRIQVIDSTPANLTRASLEEQSGADGVAAVQAPLAGDTAVAQPVVPANPLPRPRLQSTRVAEPVPASGEAEAEAEVESESEKPAGPRITRNTDFLG